MITRKHFEWRLKSRTILLGERTLIMGSLSLAPDGPDEGRYHDADRAFARAIELEEQGVDLLELVPEEALPGSKPISEAEELRRVVPVLKRLRDRISIPLGVQTWKTAVAEKVLSLGVEVIRDVSGLTWNPDLARITVQHDAGLILTHMRGTPETWGVQPAVKDVMEVTATGLAAASHRANQANVDRRRILIDPGLGMGKRREHNLEMIGRLPVLAQLGLPLIVGTSRQAFLARPDEFESEYTRVAALTAAILAGAHVVRVDDLTTMKYGIQLADALLSARPAPPAEPPPARKSEDSLASRTKVRPPLRH